MTRVGRLAGRTALRATVAFAFIWLFAIGIGPWTGRYRVITVLTGSMRPTAPPGSLIVVTPEASGDLRVGDVITFEAPIDGRPVVTHRVIEIVSGGTNPIIRTKGDANAAADPWVARLGDGPVWHARAVVPWAGALMQSLRSPFVHTLTVLAAPVAFALLALIQIWSSGNSPSTAKRIRSPRSTGAGATATG